MEFKPAYLEEKFKQLDFNNPVFSKGENLLVNPSGCAGIVTLWSSPQVVFNKLLEKFPSLFNKESNLVALTSLYSNGLPQMLANLAHNPQITHIAITGNETDSVPSSKYLLNFLNEGVDVLEGNPMAIIKGTAFPIDTQLKPEMFKHLKVGKFDLKNLEGIVDFVSKTPLCRRDKTPRIEIKLAEPKFTDFPSDITSHQILAKTPLDAWMEVIYKIDRFGVNVPLEKGPRRALYNLDVHVENPGFEDEAKLRRFGFDPEELKSYKNEILEGDLGEGVNYSYGNRMRKHFNVDALEAVIDRLKEDKLDRRGFISLWDTENDIISDKSSDSSVPCLTDIYFTLADEKLILDANFRTHNAGSAWLLNFYGLRSIQEYVSEKTGLPAGKINVKSRWIGLDPSSGKTASALQLLEKHRRIPIDVNDPIGYFVIEPRDSLICADHFHPNGQKLKTYKGKTAFEIKNQLRQSGINAGMDHAMWIGHELARAEYVLNGEIPEL